MTPTKKQTALLEELQRYQDEHYGQAPSLAQLGRLVGRHRQNVHASMQALLELGLVVRVGEGQSTKYVAVHGLEEEKCQL